MSDFVSSGSVFTSHAVVQSKSSLIILIIRREMCSRCRYENHCAVLVTSRNVLFMIMHGVNFISYLRLCKLYEKDVSYEISYLCVSR